VRVQSFFGTTVADWDDPAGQLHAYLLPDQNTLAPLDRAAKQLRGFDFLGVQPESAMHFTVQRFPHLLSERVPVTALAATAQSYLTGLGPLELKLGEATVTENSVIVPASCVQWDELVARTRSAAEAVLPRTAAGEVPLVYNAPRPHITLAYARAAGEIKQPPVASLWPRTVQIASLAWCAVHMDPADGVYTFDVLAESEFSPAR
jgi:hypothetical protein